MSQITFNLEEENLKTRAIMAQVGVSDHIIKPCFDSFTPCCEECGVSLMIHPTRIKLAPIMKFEESRNLPIIDIVNNNNDYVIIIVNEAISIEERKDIDVLAYQFGWDFQEEHLFPDQTIMRYGKPKPQIEHSLDYGMMFKTEEEAEKWIEQFSDLVFGRV